MSLLIESGGHVRLQTGPMNEGEALERAHDFAGAVREHLIALRSLIYSSEANLSVDRQTIHELLIDELGLMRSHYRVNASGDDAWVDAELGGQR